MNLDNLNLVELNAQEMKEVEGGFFGFLVVLFMGWCFANLLTNGALAPQ